MNYWYIQGYLFITIPKAGDSLFASILKPPGAQIKTLEPFKAGSSHCAIRVRGHMACGQFVRQINFAWQRYNESLLDPWPECKREQEGECKKYYVSIVNNANVSQNRGKSMEGYADSSIILISQRFAQLLLPALLSRAGGGESCFQDFALWSATAIK